MAPPDGGTETIGNKYELHAHLENMFNDGMALTTPSSHHREMTLSHD